VHSGHYVATIRQPQAGIPGESERPDEWILFNGWTFVGNESFQAVVGRNLAAPTDVALLVTSRRCRGSSVLPGVIGVGESSAQGTSSDGEMIDWRDTNVD
jgi:hypothetical protein